MNYGQAIRFPFSGEKPWQNIALLAVCNLIPVIGPLVVLGYGAQLARVLARNLDAAPPTFDFGKFSKYLEGGVAPFVIQLIVTFIALPIMWGLMIGGMLIVAASGAKVWGFAIGLSVMIGGILTMVVVMGLTTLPLVLRAMLLGNIGKAFDMKWCLDFVKRTWGPALVSLIVLPLIAIPLAIVGVLACYIGVFFVGGIITLIHVHIQVQLYHVYLDRGGTALEIFDDPIPPAFPVVSPQPISR